MSEEERRHVQYVVNFKPVDRQSGQRRHEKFVGIRIGKIEVAKIVLGAENFDSQSSVEVGFEKKWP